jgi:RNA polymerase sigma-70 factor (ECF subfamily)
MSESRPPSPPRPPGPAGAGPAARAGAGEDYGAFFQATLGPLRRYLARLLGCREEAQDIAQAAYERVFRAMGRGAVEHPRALLYTTARHLALDEIKHRRRSPFEAAPLAGECVPAPGGVAETVAGEEERRLLRAAISSLPEACREVLLLRLGEQLPHAAIAARLRIPRKTVEKRLYRAMRLLHDALRPAAAEGGSVVPLPASTGTQPRP